MSYPLLGADGGPYASDVEGRWGAWKNGHGDVHHRRIASANCA
ncbi:MAG: hypothetical protein WBH47_23945 [Streptosporangiaceae bacterium]